MCLNNMAAPTCSLIVKHTFVGIYMEDVRCTREIHWQHCMYDLGFLVAKEKETIQ